VHGTPHISVQRLVNESSCRFSGKIAQAKPGLTMRSQVQLGNESRSKICTPGGDIPFAKLELGAHMRPQAGAWEREEIFLPFQRQDRPSQAWANHAFPSTTWERE
jgi:hypothetical protein